LAVEAQKQYWSNRNALAGVLAGLI